MIFLEGWLKKHTISDGASGIRYKRKEVLPLRRGRHMCLSYVPIMRGEMGVRWAPWIPPPFVTRTGLGNEWVIVGDRPGDPS